MSVFTSLVTKELPVPADPAHRVVIRKLAPKHLAEAAKLNQRAAFEDLRALGSTAFLQEVMALVGGTDTSASAAIDTVAATASPLTRYDVATLLQHGVVGWTYEQALTRESFEDLEADTQEWMATEVLRLAKPSLFASEAADAKNG